MRIGWWLGAIAPLVAAAAARGDVSPPPQPAGHHSGACSEFHDFKFPTHIGADGIPDAVIRRSFDGKGRPASEDWQRDDAPHRTAAFRYDDAGRLEREEVRLAGGKLVSVTTHRYDRAGREIQIGIDENGDGNPDWLTIKTYDRNGRLATMRENVKAGTHRNGIGHWYRYDANDRLVLEKIDNDGDGAPNLETGYKYDERGLLVDEHARWYDGMDGDHFTYAYDDAQRLVAKTDRLGFTWTHRYDRAGNLVEKVQEPPKKLTDRTPMIRITYDYGCWK
jgi:YD repeat-containing protein